MSKPVHSTYEHSADVETVFGLLAAATWAERKGAVLKDGSRLLERDERPDGGVRLVSSRELPAGVPGFLEKFLPRDGRVVQTDDWGPIVDGVRRGIWSVELPGAPVRMGGTLLLEPAPAGSRYTIDGEVKVSVPLIGGKAESFVAGMVIKLGAKESDVLEAEVTGG